MKINLRRDIAEVGKLAREVVAKRVAITGAVTTIASVAVAYHWITPGVSSYVNSWVTRGIDVLALVVGALWVRSGVTPADPTLGPTSSNGLPLNEQPVPFGDGGSVN